MPVLKIVDRADLTPNPLRGVNIGFHERRPMLGANIGVADIPSASPDPRVADIISLYA